MLSLHARCALLVSSTFAGSAVCFVVVVGVCRSALVVSRGSVGGAQLGEDGMQEQDHGMHDSFNSGGAGGLLLVCKSTSYNLEGCSQGPTEEEVYQRWGFRSGQRFAPCLRGGDRGTFSAGRLFAGADCRFTYTVGNQEQVPKLEVRSHLPSEHPEVPDSQFVSPGREVDIRQSMGWDEGV